MNLVIELLHPKYGNIIYSKPGLVVKSAATSHSKQIKILTIEVGNLTSVYKSTNTDFTFDNCDTKIVLGSFHSHSITWEIPRK